MKVMSIDIETTGLNPLKHGVTEFAAILFDTNEPNLLPKTFYRWVNPEDYVWSNFCLKLHATWITRILDRLDKKQIMELNLAEPPICKDTYQLREEFLNWYSIIDSEGYKELIAKKRGNITGTGKNFGTFDLKFLEMATFKDVFRHRTFEWVNMYHRKEDKVPPDLTMCKSRAIALGCRAFAAENVAHNALDDAMDVYELITFGNQYYANARMPLVDERR